MPQVKCTKARCVLGEGLLRHNFFAVGQIKVISFTRKTTCFQSRCVFACQMPSPPIRVGRTCGLGMSCGRVQTHRWKQQCQQYIHYFKWMNLEELFQLVSQGFTDCASHQCKCDLRPFQHYLCSLTCLHQSNKTTCWFVACNSKVFVCFSIFMC